MYDRIKYIFILFFLLPLFVLGQINSKKSNILPNDFVGVELNAGFTSFFGDIDEGPAKGEYFPYVLAYGVQVYKSFGSIIMLGGELDAGGVSGQKNRYGSGSKPALRYFYARFVDYTLTAQINLLAFFNKNLRRRINLFAKVGIGLTDFRTKLYDGSNDSIIQSYGYFGEKSTTELMIPLGIKATAGISNSFSLSVDFTIKRSDTDKLDGVTGNNNRDYYSFFSVGVVYKLCSGGKCFSFSAGKHKSKKSSTKKPKSAGSL